ncbi:MAG: DNA recombination protein RmuC [Candidatus Omnitrophota bacterium]|nr:DNA recombination protein RmuC [Candidatus Omnitrophota bacterium]
MGILSGLIGILIVLTAAGLFFIYPAFKKISKDSEQDKGLALLQNQIENLSKSIGDRLAETNQSLQRQFSESVSIVRDVTEKLVKLESANKQIIDYASQLKSLENILKSPKQRGLLGEYFLETLLDNTFPPGQYKMQYSFADNSIVDAVIFVKDKVIPIDAKFSLERYEQLCNEKNRERTAEIERELKTDLKNRINETSKYIKPDEGTTDFAIMFIPAEGVFYNLLSFKVGALEASSVNLIEYAYSKHVIITSPTTFLAYLQTILQALHALKIEESVKDVIKKVKELGRHLTSYDELMRRVGKNLNTTVGSYNSAYKEFAKIDKDVSKIGGAERTVEPLLIDKPENN